MPNISYKNYNKLKNTMYSMEENDLKIKLCNSSFFEPFFKVIKTRVAQTISNSSCHLPQHQAVPENVCGRINE